VTLDQLQPIIRALRTESDRACAVLGLATIDAFLESSLRAVMVSDAPDELFEGTAPCATLSGKIELAFSLGIVSQEERRDLGLLRKIRNDFAHAVDHELSFANQRVSSRVAALTTPKLFEGTVLLRGENDIPRFRFELAVSILAMALGARQHGLRRPSVSISPTHLTGDWSKWPSPE
jgi:DNA-binding MltR family transcriptional regulator